MPAKQNGPDDLDVSLEWPDRDPSQPEDLVTTEAPERGDAQVHTEETVEAAEPGSDHHLALQLSPGDLGENAQLPLAAIAIRLEALSAASTMMRVAVSDRLTDLSDQLSRAVTSTARDVDDYRRLHDRAMADIRERLSDLEAAAGRMAGDRTNWQQALDSHRGALLDRLEESWGPALEQSAGSARSQVELIEQLRDAMTQLATTQAAGLSRLQETVSGLATTRPEATDQGEAVAQLNESIGQMAAAQAKAVRQLNVAITDAATAQTEAVAQLHRAVGELAAAQEDSLSLIRDAVDSAPAGPDAGEDTRTQIAAQQAHFLEQLDNRLAHLESIASAPSGAPVGDQAVVDRLDRLTTQVEALRRRIALRARSEPMLDVAAIDTLAESIAERLGEGSEVAATDQTHSRRRRGSRP